MSAFADVRDLEPLRIWAGVAGRVVHGERITLGAIELAAGTAIPEHRHDNEQLGIVVTGSVTFRVGDETRELGPGGTWRIRPHVPHAVAAGPSGAVVVEAFAPARADWAGLERAEPYRPRWP